MAEPRFALKQQVIINKVGRPSAKVLSIAIGNPYQYFVQLETLIEGTQLQDSAWFEEALLAPVAGVALPLVASGDSLAALRERLAAIDGAPTNELWKITREQIDGTFIFGTQLYGDVGICWNMLNARNNAEFIAHAPDDIRSLLSRIAALEAERDAAVARADALAKALEPFASVFEIWLARDEVDTTFTQWLQRYPNLNALRREYEAAANALDGEC